MSFEAFLEDVAALNFSHAGKRVADFFRSTAWPGLKTLVTKASSDEGEILKSLIPIAVNDVVAGGFATEAFINAGKNVLAQLIAKNIATFNMQYIMALINAEVAPLAPPVALSAAQPTA